MTNVQPCASPYITIASPFFQLGCSDGAYFVRMSVPSLTPVVFACAAYDELSRYEVEITPSRLAPLAPAASMNTRFADTLPRKTCGDQPTFPAVTRDTIVWVGSAKITSVSAPADLSARICCVSVVCDGSYD